MQQFFSALDLLGMLATDPRMVSLLLLVAVAAVIDLRTYRIPNWLTFTGIALGLVINTITPSMLHQGFWWAATGVLLGFVMALPLYLLRVMGAGDVKLIAMVGAFLGASGTIYAVLCIFIIGGVAAVLYAATHKLFSPMLTNVKAIAQQAVLSSIGGLAPTLEMKLSQSIGKLPYGVSIAVGTFFYVVANQLGYC